MIAYKKRICGFDIGIKNLSFCVLNVYENKFDIEKWVNLDLTADAKHKCVAVLGGKKGKKKGKQEPIIKICDSPAKFECVIDGISQYYCGAHKSHAKANLSPESNANIENDYVKPNNTVGAICAHILKSNKKKACGKKAGFIIDNVSCCKAHKDQLLKAHIKNVSIKSLKKVKCMHFDPQDLCERLYNKLGEYLELFKTIDEYYIENQPAPLNPSMKTVSVMVFSYFVFMAQINKLNSNVKFVGANSKIKLDAILLAYVQVIIKAHFDSPAKKVDCNCPICKLDIDIKANQAKHGLNYSKYKITYDSTKLLGIYYTRKILGDLKFDDQVKLLDMASKQDDLADSFLHAYKKVII